MSRCGFCTLMRLDYKCVQLVEQSAAVNRRRAVGVGVNALVVRYETGLQRNKKCDVVLKVYR